MDKSKWEIFSKLLGNELANLDGGNAFPSGQQKQQNIPAGNVINIMDYALSRDKL